jgi:ribose 5-phosphate isomerase B
VTYTVKRMLTAAGPAKVWIGLKNNGDAGLRLDLRAQVLVNGAVAAIGELPNVSAGGGGFNKAILQSIAMSLVSGPVEVPPFAMVSLRVVARRACSGGGPNAGTVRDGSLYCAHSNFPRVPMASSVEIFDTGTMKHVGTHSLDSVDYPDYAALVAQKVGSGEVVRGILICGSGIGMCIAANKVPGVRAAPCHDDLTAEMSRRHNDLNLLCLSADMLGERLIDRMVEIWLATEFEGGRHARRVEKISQMEKK